MINLNKKYHDKYGQIIFAHNYRGSIKKYHDEFAWKLEIDLI